MIGCISNLGLKCKEYSKVLLFCKYFIYPAVLKYNCLNLKGIFCQLNYHHYPKAGWCYPVTDVICVAQQSYLLTSWLNSCFLKGFPFHAWSYTAGYPNPLKNKPSTFSTQYRMLCSLPLNSNKMLECMFVSSKTILSLVLGILLRQDSLLHLGLHSTLIWALLLIA